MYGLAAAFKFYNAPWKPESIALGIVLSYDCLLRSVYMVGEGEMGIVLARSCRIEVEVIRSKGRMNVSVSGL